MNINQLKSFVEVVRSDFNITNAAEKLYTSQPTVSKQLKILEDELNVSLFNRKIITYYRSVRLVKKFIVLPAIFWRSLIKLKVWYHTKIPRQNRISVLPPPTRKSVINYRK